MNFCSYLSPSIPRLLYFLVAPPMPRCLHPSSAGQVPMMPPNPTTAPEKRLRLCRAEALARAKTPPCQPFRSPQPGCPSRTIDLSPSPLATSPVYLVPSLPLFLAFLPSIIPLQSYCFLSSNSSIVHLNLRCLPLQPQQRNPPPPSNYTFLTSCKLPSPRPHTSSHTTTAATQS